MEFSLGLVEVSSLGNAIMMLDEMVKAADVEFVAVERKLGGRLVTIVVRGSVSSVTAAVDAGKEFAKRQGCLKAAEVIARPHPEILKFIHLDKENEKKPNTESAADHTGSIGKTAGKKAEPPKEVQPKKTAGKKAGKTKSQAAEASDIKTSPKRGRKTK